MENSPRHQENQNPSLIPSPKSYGSNNSSSSSTTSSTTNSNGLHHHHHHQQHHQHHQNHHQQQHHHLPPPQSPIPITRSEPNNPYPTTFVQADTSSFKQVVQMLTGSTESAKGGASAPNRTEPFRNPIPPIRNIPKKEKSGSKLYERRNSFKNFKINPLGPGLVQNIAGGLTGSPRTNTPEILSPSILDFPSLALSPVTPLIPDPFNRAPHPKTNLNMVAEDKAIAQKGFYLHPSPSNTPKDSEPRLLPLFPVTSPRLSGSSDSSNP